MLDIDTNYQKNPLILKNLPDNLFGMEANANFVVVCSQISKISNVASISIVIQNKKRIHIRNIKKY